MCRHMKVNSFQFKANREAEPPNAAESIAQALVQSQFLKRLWPLRFARLAHVGELLLATRIGGI